jgi:glycosyltransferase involved in cell wall biosynthesis
MAKEGYIPQADRKKILLLCDDIRFTSGISTMAKEIVIGTSHRFNWVNLGAAITHPDQGKRFDVSQDTNVMAEITDSSVFIIPTSGYGNPDLLRQIIEMEKPDAIMFFTDPRYWIWLFQMENEIRKKIPMIYLNIWDDLPAPLYNKPYYESCDTLLAISKQTRNINELVLGDKAKDKVIKYVPHGINEKVFFPLPKDTPEVQTMRKMYFGDDQPEFVVFYNARNIRRKCTSDLILAYSQFCDKIGKEKAKKCALLLHTQRMDENGTDLPAVVELFCDPEYQRVVFSEHRYSPHQMCHLYNCADVVTLTSSNEGWGLSLTEGMMTGKMIIGTVTGGMQDQMRFEDENGDWLNLTKDFPSNHFGTYKKHGEWARPLFPTNMSIVGSIPTPYIFDDRADFRDIAKAIEEVYNLSPEERERRGLKGREWATSEESMQSARMMSKNIIDGVEETFAKWKPRKKHELIKVQKAARKKATHPLVY